MKNQIILSEDRPLTRREKEILALIAEGYSNKQLADKLDLSLTTITKHRSNMLHKTHTPNVANLIAFAYQNHII